jgi:hypothetical protein
MADPKKVLIVVGSPKGKISASSTMGTFLAEKIGLGPAQAQVQYLAIARNSEESYGRLLASMAQAEVLVFVFPLYADQLPSGLVETLERYTEFLEKHRLSKPQAVAGIVNCGFPEPSQNDSALAILKRFTELQSFDWLGGLALGGGGIVEGDKPLSAQGGRVYHVARALELAVSAIGKGISLPEEAQRLMRKQIIPAFLYRWMGNWSFKKAAKKWGVTKKQLSTRPF